jgi:phosphoribosylformylglycinamidine cyclo-ligase
MPGIYQHDDFDLAGTIVGIVDREQMFTRENVKEGDILIGLKSSGLHTNGYSLARKALLAQYEIESLPAELNGESIADALLKVHRSYLKPIQNLLGKFKPVEDIHALSHITGGGIVGNTSRVLSENLSLDIVWSSWERPAIFKLIQSAANVPEEDMRRTFNLGIGFILIVEPSKAAAITSALRSAGEEPVEMGKVTAR